MQTLVFGIVSGSILAMATIGFTMVRQTGGFLHIGHSQVLMLGAYVAWFLSESLGLPFVVAAVGAVAAGAVVSLLLGMFLFAPLRGKGPLAKLFTSIGGAYLLYGLVGAGFGGQVRIFSQTLGQPRTIAGITISGGELLIVGVTLASVVLLHLFLTGTQMGLWIRALATNPELGATRGVPAERVSSVVWLIAGGLAAAAGVMVGVVGTVNPYIGWSYILLIVAAAVVGGLGSVYGVILACVGLGIVMDLSTLVIPTAYRSAVAFLVLAVTLLLRPDGLLTISKRSQAA